MAKSRCRTGLWVGWVVAGMMWFGLTGQAWAAVPQTMNFQGRLNHSDGTPVNEEVSIEFAIYDAEAGGPVLWSEARTIPVQNGLFSLNLGEVNPIYLPFDVPYYLGVRVGTDPEMVPRQPLSSVGYAFRAITAEIDGDTLAGLLCAPGAVAKWTGEQWVCAIDEDTVLSEAEVESYIANGAIDLAPGTSVDSQPISTGLHTTSLDWDAITSKPAGFADGIDNDSHLSETEVESYIANGAIDLAPGTSVDSQPISTGLHTTSLDWDAINAKPAGFADGVDDDAVGGLSCVEGQVVKYLSGAWACASESVGGGGDYAGVAVVAKSGGDYTDPVAAMNDTASWCGVPSASNPCLLKIMPGVYDIGASYIIMKPYVDIEGSGESSLVVGYGYDHCSYAACNDGVVNGSEDSELRNVSILATGDGVSEYKHVKAIVSSGDGPGDKPFKVTHVKATARNLGSYYSQAFFSFGADAEVVDSNIICENGTGGCIHMYTGVNNLSIRNSRIVAAEDVAYLVYDNTLKIENSVIIGTSSVNSFSPQTTSRVYIANSRLEDAPSSSAYVTCAGVYDGDFTFYPSTCP